MLLHIKTFYRVTCALLYCCYRFLNPVLVTFVIVSSSLLTYNFGPLKKSHPYLSSSINFFTLHSLAIFIFCSALALIFSIIDSILIRPSINNLRSELIVTKKELNDEKEKNSVIAEQIRTIFDGFMYNLAQKLEFNRSDERITLMVHDGINCFIPISRYSPNPSFAGHVTKSTYPDNQGVISIGWQQSWCYDKRNPKTDFVDYNHSKYGIPKTTLKKIRMKSSLYCAKRIDHQGKNIALVLLESLRPNIFTENDILKKFEAEENYIGALIMQLNDYIPLPSNAKSRGL